MNTKNVVRFSKQLDQASVRLTITPVRRRDAKPRQAGVYPKEFIEAMKNTILKTLMDTLVQSHARAEVIDLVEELYILSMNYDEGEAGDFILLDTVASATRNVAALGGSFYGPYGEVME